MASRCSGTSATPSGPAGSPSASPAPLLTPRPTSGSDKPGVLIGVDGPPSEAIAPVPIDFRCVQVAIQDIEQLWRWMQFGTGITEEAVGMSGPAGGDRQTAREFLGKMENVQRRIVSETMGAARDVVLPLAEAF